MVGSCRADFDNGFPDQLKRSAFEEIIGNYYLFDPFMQPGRRGRELESHFESFIHPNSVPSEETSVLEEDGDDDPTLYSIPPAITPAQAKDQMTQNDEIPVAVTKLPTGHRDLVQISDHQQKNKVNSAANTAPKEEPSTEEDQEYHIYPPFLTEESVRQPQQLVPVPIKSRQLPRYVIGVAGKKRVGNGGEPFNGRQSSEYHQTIYRDQIAKKNDAVIELDDSPFAKRSSIPNYFDNLWSPIVDRVDGERIGRYNSQDAPKRGIRNGYYHLPAQ